MHRSGSHWPPVGSSLKVISCVVEAFSSVMNVVVAESKRLADYSTGAVYAGVPLLALFTAVILID